MDKGGEVRPELDQAVMPQVRGQPGEAGAVHPGLQPGELGQKAGLAGGDKALVADQSSDQANQDRWAAGTTRSQTGVSACRGAGDQGNAGRDIGTDQLASAGTWLACVESAGVYDSDGVVQRKQAAPREQLGQRQAILNSGGWRGGSCAMRAGQLSESEAS